MKDYFPDLKDLKCLYDSHDFLNSVIQLKGVTANIKISDITDCFEELKLPIEYMKCKL
jgi:hypothetical protein